MSIHHKDEQVRLKLDEDHENNFNNENNKLNEELAPGILSKSELLILEKEGKLCLFGGFCLNLVIYSSFFVQFIHKDCIIV